MEHNYMLDEILSYPTLMDAVYEPLYRQAESVIPDEVLQQVDTVYIYGSGDSLNAANCVCQSFWDFARIPAYPIPALQASRYIAHSLTPGLAQKTLTICISNSGSAARSVEAAGALRRAGCRTAAITANPASGVGSHTEYILEAKAPAFPQAPLPVPGIRSFALPVIGLNLLAIRMGLVRGALTKPQAQALRQELQELSVVLHTAFQQNGDTLRAFAARCAASERMEFLAAGPCRGAADFGVSKVLEAQGYSVLSQDLEEFAHQTFFSLDTHSLPTVLIAPSRSRSLSRAREILSVLQHLERPILVLTDDPAAIPAAPGVQTVCLCRPVRETLAPLVFSALMTYLSSVMPLRDGDVYMHGHSGVYCEEGLPTVRGSKIEIDEAGGSVNGTEI